MSETTSPDATRDVKHNFRVTMLHHPSHHVTDLGEAERWFERVFGRGSTPIAKILSNLPVRPDWPLDYAQYTLISDVLFDSIDPKRFVVEGVQRYKTVEQPHLKDFGWCMAGLAELYRELRRHGYQLTTTLGELFEGNDPPGGADGRVTFYSLREDTGLRYHFHPPIPGDPRTTPGWEVPRVTERDPLGIVYCSHHTILTSQPERALRLLNILGGEIVHTGRDEVRGTTGTCVYLAGSIFEYAVPDPGTVAHEDLAKDDPNDTYHAITWKVADLVRTERHLESQGVRIVMRSEDTIVTDPTTSLGIPWGFSSTLLPGDPRRAADQNPRT